MRALSLIQPWAWLVIVGWKDVENRRWHLPKSMVGKRFLVHASSKRSRAEYDRAAAVARELGLGLPHFDDLVRGGIFGSARVTACLCPPGPEAGDEVPAWKRSPWWFRDQHGFVLADRRVLPFVPCKGALRFWRVPEDVLRKTEVPRAR